MVGGGARAMRPMNAVGHQRIYPRVLEVTMMSWGMVGRRPMPKAMVTTTEYGPIILTVLAMLMGWGATGGQRRLSAAAATMELKPMTRAVAVATR